MRFIFTVAALIIIALVALAFVGEQIGVEPPIELPSSIEAPEIPQHILDKIRVNKGDTSTITYYKWQDKDGAWHYSETAPANMKATPVILGNEIKAAD